MQVKQSGFLGMGGVVADTIDSPTMSKTLDAEIADINDVLITLVSENHSSSAVSTLHV